MQTETKTLELFFIFTNGSYDGSFAVKGNRTKIQKRVSVYHI